MKKLSEKYPSRLKSKESHNVRLTTQNNDIDEFDYRLEENVFFFWKTNQIAVLIGQSLTFWK